jgi:DnaJ-class molecular chaperone
MRLLLSTRCFYRSITYWKYSDSPLDVLQISKSCTQKQLKLKFYELSKAYHPDKTLGLNDSARKAKTDYYLKVQLAYELLKDKESREYYFVSQKPFKSSHQYQYQDRHHTQYHYQNQYSKSDTEKTVDDIRIWLLTSAFIFFTYSIGSKNYENSQKRELDLAWQLHYEQAHDQGLDDVVSRSE